MQGEKLNYRLSHFPTHAFCFFASGSSLGFALFFSLFMHDWLLHGIQLALRGGGGFSVSTSTSPFGPASLYPNYPGRRTKKPSPLLIISNVHALPFAKWGKKIRGERKMIIVWETAKGKSKTFYLLTWVSYSVSYLVSHFSLYSVWYLVSHFCSWTVSYLVSYTVSHFWSYCVSYTVSHFCSWMVWHWNQEEKRMMRRRRLGAKKKNQLIRSGSLACGKLSSLKRAGIICRGRICFFFFSSSVDPSISWFPRKSAPLLYRKEGRKG